MKVSALITTAALLSFADTLQGSMKVELLDVAFNSANSVRCQWSYYRSDLVTGEYIPPTQLDVVQSDKGCGQGSPLDISNRTHNQVYYDQVVWGVDSRSPLTLCIRIKGQDWEFKTITQQGREPPLITTPPRQLTITDLSSRDERNRTLTCAASGYPVPRLAWWVNSERYNTSGSYNGFTFLPDNSLEIARYSGLPGDLTIKCEAQNDYGSVCSRDINIRNQVLSDDCKSIDLSRNINFNYSTGAALTCQCGPEHSHPDLEHDWTFCSGLSCRRQETDHKEEGGIANCQRITYDDRRRTVANGRTLVFSYGQDTDEGCYVCESIHSTIYTTRFSPFHITHSGQNINFEPKLLFQDPPTGRTQWGSLEATPALINQPLTLECAFQAGPTATLEWHHNGSRLVPDSRRTLSNYNSTLNITSVTYSDEGEYACIARNLMGQDMASFNIHVFAPPAVGTTTQTQKVTGFVGHNLTLTCNASHASHTKWYKNEDMAVIETTKGYSLIDDNKQLCIHTLQHSDTATYKCEVRNHYGSDTAYMALTALDVAKITNIVKRQLNPDSNDTLHYELYCNTTVDPNLSLNVSWFLDPMSCHSDIISLDMTSYPDRVHVNIQQERDWESCRVTCVARTQGMSVCKAVHILQSGEVQMTDLCGLTVTDVPPSSTTTETTEFTTEMETAEARVEEEEPPKKNAPKTSESTDHSVPSPPWHSNAYVMGGVAAAGAIIVIISIVCVARWHKKRSSSTPSRGLSQRASGRRSLTQVQYNGSRIVFPEVDYIDNSLYPSSIVCDNLKNQLKTVEVPRKSVTLGEMIGRGQFGRVYKGTLEDINYMNISANRTVAIKTLKYKADEKDMVNLFLHEALMMKGFDHQHVLRLIGITMDTDGSPLVLLPFMDRGDLRTYISSPDLDFRVIELLQMGAQVANGMTYLSSKRFVHRDLAARNCMVDKQGLVKVADFGLSRDLYSREYYRTEEGKNPLPIRWMAAESLEGKIFTSKSDVWSFGVLLWELVTRGATPYPGIENWAMARHIHQGGRMKQPIYCPTTVYDIMLECWAEHPKARPTFEILQNKLEAITTPPPSSPTANTKTSGGSPLERRDTLHMDIRTTKVTKIRGRGKENELDILKELTPQLDQFWSEQYSSNSGSQDLCIS